MHKEKVPSLEEMRKQYRDSLVPSNYQGYMADLVAHMLDTLGKDDFENYRLYGDAESKNKINTLMKKTDYWKNRETDILDSSGSPRSYDKKRAVLESIDKKVLKIFFMNMKPHISQIYLQ